MIRSYKSLVFCINERIIYKDNLKGWAKVGPIPWTVMVG